VQYGPVCVSYQKYRRLNVSNAPLTLWPQTLFGQLLTSSLLQTTSSRPSCPHHGGAPPAWPATGGLVHGGGTTGWQHRCYPRDLWRHFQDGEEDEEEDEGEAGEAGSRPSQLDIHAASPLPTPSMTTTMPPAWARLRDDLRWTQSQLRLSTSKHASSLFCPESFLSSSPFASWELSPPRIPMPWKPRTWPCRLQSLVLYHPPSLEGDPPQQSISNRWDGIGVALFVSTEREVCPCLRSHGRAMALLSWQCLPRDRSHLQFWYWTDPFP